jgi:hypothetical protein
MLLGIDKGTAHAKCVATNILWTNRKIRDFEVLYPMDVETLIENTVLDNAITLLGSHPAGTQRVPSCLAVSLHPFLDVCNVFTGVFQLFFCVPRAAIEHARLWWLLGLNRHSYEQSVFVANCSQRR